MKIFSVALIAAIFFTCAANAQENFSITLEEAINLALKNNRLIEQAKEDRESARLELSAARKNLEYLLHEQSEIECLEYALAHRPDADIQPERTSETEILSDEPFKEKNR